MCPYPVYLKKHDLFVPCGKCGSCLQRRISDWAVRLGVEHEVSAASYFVTLTYEENPIDLCKQDLQKYFKRLRKRGCSFSYFALGDYGDTFGRPHYHVIFFSRSLLDHDLLHSVWVSGEATFKRGFATVDPLTFGRISYVVRYGMLAKLDWNKGDSRPSPFFLMSKRPALGSSYVGSFQKVELVDTETGEIYVQSRFVKSRSAERHEESEFWYFPDGQFKRSLPRYFKDKIFSVVDRERHLDVFQRQAEQRTAVKIAKLRKDFKDKAESIYYGSMKRKADVFLAELRKQKLSKNKLL